LNRGFADSIAERNEIVALFNALVALLNEIIALFNEIVARHETLVAPLHETLSRCDGRVAPLAGSVTADNPIAAAARGGTVRLHHGVTEACESVMRE
jgi:hypothetical protein